MSNLPNLVPSDPLGQNTKSQVDSGVFEALFPTENRVRVRLNRVNTGGLVPNTALQPNNRLTDE